MKKRKKSIIAVFLSGIANIFSFKEYSRRRKENYFTKRRNL
jgi:hypothetical protein